MIHILDKEEDDGVSGTKDTTFHISGHTVVFYLYFLQDLQRNKGNLSLTTIVCLLCVYNSLSREAEVISD